MSGFTPAETTACCHLIDLALKEDLGSEAAARDDVTSFFLLPPGQTGTAHLVARTKGIVAGLPAVRLVLAALDERLILTLHMTDGDAVGPGDRLAIISGPITAMLAAERTALNFLQRLSGVATLTRRYVDELEGLPCRILDTRKTTPGWRLLEKYAVRCGGGHNHRMGLYDMFLIKDNHLAAGRQAQRTLGEAVQTAKEYAAKTGRPPLPVQVEVDSLEQLDQALAAGPDMVLLDNMSPELLRQAVARRNDRAPHVLLEASGGVNLQTVRAIAETGVDRISVGALTHSAPALDIALDYGTE